MADEETPGDAPEAPDAGPVDAPEAPVSLGPPDDAPDAAPEGDASEAPGWDGVARPISSGGSTSRGKARLSKERRLKNAKSIAPTIQQAIDYVNASILKSQAGYIVDMSRVPPPETPFDWRKNEKGEIEAMSGPLSLAMAYHGQELGLSSAQAVLEWLDNHPNVLAIAAIGGAIVVNAMHVKAIAMRCAENEARERASQNEAPVEG